MENGTKVGSCTKIEYTVFSSNRLKKVEDSQVV